MKILFVVSLFNDARWIKGALLSILRQKGGFQKEILVVDDGSRDNSGKIVQKLAQRYREIKFLRQKNKGQAAALNRGLAKARAYDFVALVESDVKIEKMWLLKNLRKFKNPGVSGVGGILHPFEDDPWIARIAGYEVEYKMEKQSVSPLHLTSANLIYRASVFSRVSRFKKELINAAFDNEFNLRLVRSGLRLVLNKKAHAWHHYKPTLKSFLKRSWAYAYYRPYLQGSASYSYDNIIRIQLLIICLGFFSIFLVYTLAITYYVLLILIVAYLLLTLPPLLWTLKRKRDPVILLYPFVSFLRNCVALAALTFGTFAKNYKTKT